MSHTTQQRVIWASTGLAQPDITLGWLSNGTQEEQRCVLTRYETLLPALDLRVVTTGRPQLALSATVLVVCAHCHRSSS